MADSVDVPKVGKVDKKVIIPIFVVAAAFVGYRYWKARQDVGDGEPVDPGYEDMQGGLGPGQTRPAGDYGLPDDDSDTGNTTGGFRGTTNSQWSEYVSDRLQQDGRWSYSVIAVALGNFLSDKPLTGEQQDIVRGAIGIAGQPPVGYHTLIPGGNTSITVAPTGVRGDSPSPSQIRVSFSAVPGAVSYNVYRSGAAVGVVGAGSASPITLVGLSPGVSYTLQVAAVSASGQVGPKSASVTVKTQGAPMAKPATPTITANSGGGRVSFKVNPVPYATKYDWFINGRLFNSTNTPAVTLTNLKSKARYSPGVTVRASAVTGSAGPQSAARSFTAK